MRNYQMNYIIDLNEFGTDKVKFECGWKYAEEAVFHLSLGVKAARENDSLLFFTLFGLSMNNFQPIFDLAT